ncbi:hypothetical protein [Aureibacter tunicatorum]|uniref:Uncharacterized protein n=1 Tax=Aureibacter tunicatorum TaxID=866807 RepID=A0AAE3XJS2_9BACT|nr:hypothetical protein [Aureibacter tunicatorum]MDR6238172.1 hypothetical protein [Aureibacter tunicatorum]
MNLVITSEKGVEVKIAHSSDYEDKFQELLDKLIFLKEVMLEESLLYFSIH